MQKSMVKTFINIVTYERRKFSSMQYMEKSLDFPIWMMDRGKILWFKAIHRPAQMDKSYFFFHFFFYLIPIDLSMTLIQLYMVSFAIKEWKNYDNKYQRSYTKVTIKKCDIYYVIKSECPCAPPHPSLPEDYMWYQTLIKICIKNLR